MEFTLTQGETIIGIVWISIIGFWIGYYLATKD